MDSFSKRAALLALAFLPVAADGQTMDSGLVPLAHGGGDAGGRPPLLDVTLESSYVAAGGTDFRRLDVGDNEAVQIQFGAEVTGTTFRTEDDFGTVTGLAGCNDTLGTYRDIRISGGFSYRFSSTLSLDMDAGYSVSRVIEYTDTGEEVEFHPAPYIRLGVRMGS